jgi:hypothetical protein
MKTGRPPIVKGATRTIITVDKKQYDELRALLGDQSFASWVRETMVMTIGVLKNKEHLV